MQAELSAEVRDWRCGLLREFGAEPAGGVAHLLAKLGDHPVIEREIGRIACTGGDARGIGPPEELQRIVAHLVPQDFVDLFKQRARIAVPAPRQVGGELGEPLDAGRQVWYLSHSVVSRS